VPRINRGRTAAWRPKAQHRDVVHAMVHEVRADGVACRIPARKGELELVPTPSRTETELARRFFSHPARKKAAEAADLAEQPRGDACRRAMEARVALTRWHRRFNVNAGGGVKRFSFLRPEKLKKLLKRGARRENFARSAKNKENTCNVYFFLAINPQHLNWNAEKLLHSNNNFTSCEFSCLSQMSQRDWGTPVNLNGVFDTFFLAEMGKPSS